MSFFKNLFKKGLQGDPGGAAPETAGEGNQTSVADSFSFGVEREMKESGEKGGTEDINIGIGELQESSEGNQAFVADSFSFGVEREMKESGEKGGTEDINIGVGELQEANISKSMDMASDDTGLDFMKEGPETGPEPHLATPGASDGDEDAWPVKWNVADTDPDASPEQGLQVAISDGTSTGGPDSVPGDGSVRPAEFQPGAPGAESAAPDGADGIIIIGGKPAGAPGDEVGIQDLMTPGGQSAAPGEEAGIIIIGGKPEDIDDGPATLTHLGNSGPGLTPLPGSLADVADASDLDDVEAPDL